MIRIHKPITEASPKPHARINDNRIFGVEKKSNNPD